jgi:AraC-like DNA-binding protein
MDVSKIYREIDFCIDSLSLVLEGSLARGHIPVRKGGRHLCGIIYVLSGTAHYKLRNANFDVIPGNVFILSRGCQYTIDITSDDYKYIYADFSIDNYMDCDILDNVYTLRNHDVLESLFSKMNTIWFYKNTAYKLKAKSLLYDILAVIIQNKSLSYVPNYKRKQIENVVIYIENNFTDKDLYIKKVAAMSSLSEVHFRRLFKDIFLVPPKKYLMSLRINRAKDLLKEGFWSITDIAGMVGYSNVYYFSQSFQKEVGKCPTEYAKIYMNQ